MFQVFVGEDHGFGLKEISQIAQVVIAIVNLLLAGYVFYYAKGKDRRVEQQASQLHEQNIKLQWFKELVLQPNLACIKNFFTALDTLERKIAGSPLAPNDRQELSAFIKSESHQYRKAFVDLLYGVDTGLGRSIKDNMDNLVDSLTTAIFDATINLKDPITFDKEVRSKIAESYNLLISLIYNYKGVNKS
ncbi:MAG: hypothetical protein WCJ26_12620 [bacterium]